MDTLNKLYRIVNVMGGFKNNRKITDNNPLANYHTLDHAKEGLKSFYKNYIDTLDDESKKEVTVFWSSNEDEVIINYQDNQICKSTIYEVEFVLGGDIITNSIVKYRGCTVSHIDGASGLYSIKSADNINVSCKSTISEALNFIDWLALIINDGED